MRRDDETAANPYLTPAVLHVVHHPDYVVAASGGAHHFSKYGAVMDVLRAGGDLTEHLPEAMPAEWLKAAHDPGYVDSVLIASVAPDIERRIGFAVTPAVARRASVSVGGTLLAASLALEHGFAANAAGGSHHAYAEGGAGYCVFNDLVVASLRLLAEGRAKKILIVDCDVHQGDGTARMMADNARIATLSIHAERNFPVRKAASTVDIGLPDRTGDDDYCAALAPALDDLLDRFRPDFVFYQAGVDVHIDDKLGRLALTDAGIAARDRLVATALRTRAIPFASTLGGGYGADIAAVAARHAATMRTLVDAYSG